MDNGGNVPAISSRSGIVAAYERNKSSQSGKQAGVIFIHNIGESQSQPSNNNYINIDAIDDVTSQDNNETQIWIEGIYFGINV